MQPKIINLEHKWNTIDEKLNQFRIMGYLWNLIIQKPK